MKLKQRVDGRIFKGVFSIFMCVAISLGQFTPVKAADNSGYIARGDAAAIILEAADDYNSGLTYGDIMAGYPGGETYEERLITKAEAAVMISRGFGVIPEPKGAALRMGNFDESYTDVPQWARNEVQKLQEAGVLTGISPTALGADEPITEQEFRRIISRIWQIFGTNLKDDFYSYVNRDFLENAEIPKGMPYNDGLTEITLTIREEMGGLLDELVRGHYDQGTSEQIVSDFYKNMLNAEAANSEGINPIKPILERYDAAATIDELLEADFFARQNAGESVFFGMNLAVSLRDSNRYVLTFRIPNLPLSKPEYLSNLEVSAAYKRHLKMLLELAGEDDAAQKAEEVFNFEKKIAEHLKDPAETIDIANIITQTSMPAIKDVFPNVDIGKIAEAHGVKLKDGQTIYALEIEAARQFAAAFTEDNLDLLKSYAKSRLLRNNTRLLSDDFRTAYNTFLKEARGIESAARKDWAIDTTLSYLGEYFGPMYVERFASRQAKADVEKMIEQFIEVYYGRIEALDWMSDTTKAAAKKKLDSLVVKVGYPDKWSNFLDGYEIKPYSEGGSAFNSLATVKLAASNKKISEYELPVDKTEWALNVYEVNAYYNPEANEIVFPAAILRAPFYDENASNSENLGGIGVVIAHEISHAFDNNGGKYDENGNRENWWTAEDFKRFEEKCLAVLECYDDLEVAPGIINDGKLTLGENIADLGGVNCALEVAKKDPAYDPAAFFKAYGRLWKGVLIKEIAAYISQMDEHSAKSVRVNRTLQNIDEFYETFGITEKDGMYLPKEKRVGIW